MAMTCQEEVATVRGALGFCAEVHDADLFERAMTALDTITAELERLREERDDAVRLGWDQDVVARQDIEALTARAEQLERNQEYLLKRNTVLNEAAASLFVERNQAGIRAARAEEALRVIAGYDDPYLAPDELSRYARAALAPNPAEDRCPTCGSKFPGRYLNGCMDGWHGPDGDPGGWTGSVLDPTEED
jgi:hypothetical protein